jgi:dTDP-4-dehydrorhamnose reductase
VLTFDRIEEHFAATACDPRSEGSELLCLLIGKNGQVGWELRRTLSSLGEVISVDRPEIELSSCDSIRGTIREHAPQVIINAAAYTAVDRAEDEPELAMQINATAQAVMAEEAKRLGALFVTYSTDYVFDGTKSGAYTEDDVPSPLSAYGRTKVAGDNAVRDGGGAYLIFRTSWVYGARGKNFLLTMIKLATELEELKVVDDQIGSPTWSRALAEVTAQVIAQRARGSQLGNASTADAFAEIRGTYNLTCSGRTSWCGFTKAIVDLLSTYDDTPLARILPISSAEYPVRALRPKNSILDNAKLQRTFGLRLPEWNVALDHVMDELQTITPLGSRVAVGERR